MLKDSIYVDSDIFIYSAIYDPSEVEEARLANNVLLKICKGLMVAYTSTLTWDEVVWIVWSVAGRQAAIRQGSALLSLPNLRLLSVDEKSVLKAQEILEKYNLAPRDSLHVGVALSNNITRILSEDPDLDAVREIRRTSLAELK